MNRIEYMTKLASLLQDIPEVERRDAMTSSDTQIAEERRNLFLLPDFLRELSVTH